jgi:excisionase family DNA binding protein
MDEPTILTLKEVAELLRIAEKTAYTLAAEGAIPGFKVGGQWRFLRADLLAWVERQKEAGNSTPKQEQ